MASMPIPKRATAPMKSRCLLVAGLPCERGSRDQYQPVDRATERSAKPRGGKSSRDVQSQTLALAPAACKGASLRVPPRRLWLALVKTD